MKIKIGFALIALTWLVLSALSPQFSTACAQGTAFTYQGRLDDSGGPAGGTYNLKFSLFNTNTTGVPIAGPVTNSAVSVTNGLFTVPVDFGPGAFTGGSNWLEIGVETNGGGLFTTLTPRQQLSPVPYAIFAEGASNVFGVLPSGGLSGGYASAVSLNNGANSFNGSYSGNGGGLTNVNAAILGGLGSSNFWQLGGNNVASGQFLGSTNNQAVEVRANNMRALRLELNADAPNVIGGASNNVVGPGVQGATIAGGGSVATYGGPFPNRVDAFHTSIGGGLGNWIQTNAYESAIAGGNQNQIQNGAFRSFIGSGILNLIQTNAFESVIGGGEQNIIQPSALYATIAGGIDNTNNALFGFIGGGAGNYVQLNQATVSGGYENNAVGSGATVGGGAFNSAATDYGTIAGGYQNRIATNALYASVGGGTNNNIQTQGTNATIAGGVNNTIQSGDFDATISGGASNTNQTPLSAIGGGSLNLIQGSAFASTISGGFGNAIQPNATNSVIAGGTASTIQTNSYSSVIGGGYLNVIQTDAPFATIDGGAVNTIGANASLSTIGGGTFNTIGVNSALSTIAGGNFNVINPNTTNAVIAGGGNNTVRYGSYSTIAGGYACYAGYDAIGTGNYSTVGGGYGNTAQGDYSTTPGGNLNWAPGSYSFAIGNRAKALYQGDFVWADSQNADFNSTVNDQVSFRCLNGVRFTSGSGALNQTVFWLPGSGSWSFTSDRDTKDRFQSVDAQMILQKVARLPLLEWSYINYPQRHIGAMAQDFHALFPLNDNDKVLNDADLHGVALAAIQGLNEKVEVSLQNAEIRSRRLEEKLEQKETEITELKRRLEALEQVVRNLK